MKDILISIIVPAYNIREYIGRCLDSILNQTYSNIEVIAVDDGSDDGTSGVIDDYALKDGRIVAVHKENGGVSSARLTGVTKAKGDYIGFVDGDDFVEPEMFEHLLNNALKYNADISHCGYQMVFPDGHIDLYYGTGKTIEQNHFEGVKDLLTGSFVEPGLWNKLFRRAVVIGYDKSPVWDGSVRINEDLLMNYILFSKAEKSVYEDITFYRYILRKGSAATSKPQRYKLLDPIKVIKLILNDVNGNEQLYSIVYERYLRTAVSIAQQRSWKEDAADARCELRKQSLNILKQKGISLKAKLMSIGVAYFYPLFVAVRYIYNAITGADKKYDLE